MPILSTQVEPIGQSGQVPKLIYIETNDTIAEITATGYLNKLHAENIPLSSNDMALVTSSLSQGLKSSQSGLFYVVYTSSNWSLIPISPYVDQFAGQYTTKGGAAAEAISISGVVSTDLCFVQLVAPGSNTVSVNHAAVTANTLTVTFSGDPGTTAIINYQLLRLAV